MDRSIREIGIIDRVEKNCENYLNWKRSRTSQSVVRSQEGALIVEKKVNYDGSKCIVI